MVVKVKGIPVEFADGSTLIVPPLSLGALEQLHDRMVAFNGDVSDKGQIATVIDAALAALRRNYPELTRDQVAELIDLGNFIRVFDAVMDIAGAKRQAAEAPPSGEA